MIDLDCSDSGSYQVQPKNGPEFQLESEDSDAEQFSLLGLRKYKSQAEENPERLGSSRIPNTDKEPVEDSIMDNKRLIDRFRRQEKAKLAR